MGVWGQGGGGNGFDGYDYTQATKPANPKEGETWYDLDDDRALVFIDDNGTTDDLTVTDHGQLSGIQPWQHLSQTDVQSAVHDRYTDTEAIQATDGVINAATVGGQSASDLATPATTTSVAKVPFSVDDMSGTGSASDLSDGDTSTSVELDGSAGQYTGISVDGGEVSEIRVYWGSSGADYEIASGDWSTTLATGTSSEGWELFELDNPVSSFNIQVTAGTLVIGEIDFPHPTPHYHVIND